MHVSRASNVVRNRSAIIVSSSAMSSRVRTMAVPRSVAWVSSDSSRSRSVAYSSTAYGLTAPRSWKRRRNWPSRAELGDGVAAASEAQIGVTRSSAVSSARTSSGSASSSTSEVSPADSSATDASADSPGSARSTVSMASRPGRRQAASRRLRHTGERPRDRRARPVRRRPLRAATRAPAEPRVRGDPWHATAHPLRGAARARLLRPAPPRSGDRDRPRPQRGCRRVPGVRRPHGRPLPRSPREARRVPRSGSLADPERGHLAIGPPHAFFGHRGRRLRARPPVLGVAPRRFTRTRLRREAVASRP